MSNNDFISTAISKDGNKSTIRIGAESITINASTINLNGLVIATKQGK